VNHIKQLMSLTEELVPKSDDVKTEEIGDMVDSEMQLTSKAIEQAAAKIQVGDKFSVCASSNRKQILPINHHLHSYAE
jgi:hypothetical protein